MNLALSLLVKKVKYKQCVSLCFYLFIYLFSNIYLVLCALYRFYLYCTAEHISLANRSGRDNCR